MDYKDYLAGQKKDVFYFKAKNELIDLLLSKVCDFPIGKEKRLKILNVGAGMGTDLKISNKYGDNYLVDINKNALDMIEDNLYVDKRVEDACSLSYGDDFFDIVICFAVLEHVADDHKLVKEVFRVLKSGGKLLFYVPACKSIYSSHDRALNHYRRYDKPELLELLSHFKGINIHYWNFMLFFPVALLRLAKKFSPPSIDNMNMPKPIDYLLYKMMRFENFCINHNIPRPIGLELVGFCRK